MQWINFLHIYQPGNMNDYAIKEATQKSYLRIIRALEEHPQTRFTLNISGCLLASWESLGYHDLFTRIKKLMDSGRLELVGTASYHPILPLISIGEAERQIKENEAILQKYFGANFKPRGFFFPEMAYSPAVAKLIKKLGYEYLILDEIACNGKLNQTDCAQVYLDKNSALKIIFRSRKISNSYVPESILKLLQSGEDNQTIITATDGELYGLRYGDPTAIFENILTDPKLQTLTVSEFIGAQKGIPVKALASTWESTEKELKAKQPYAIWLNKKNKLQTLLWQLAKVAENSTEKFSKDKNIYWVKRHLARGLVSCVFWWASAKDFRPVFGPVAWSPDEIEKGANELVRAVRSITDQKSKPDKIKAEKLYLQIIKLTWTTHWKKF